MYATMNVGDVPFERETLSLSTIFCQVESTPLSTIGAKSSHM